jgi:hypothetical protein
VLMPDLDGARVKDTDVPFQRLVVVLGGVIAGIRKLCAWLDEAELGLHLILVATTTSATRSATQPLQAEAELARLLLREFIESGTTTILEVRDADEARLRAQEAAEVGGSDLVWLLASTWRPSEPDTNIAPGQRRGPVYREHALSVAQAPARVWVDVGRGTEERELGADGWDAWLRAFGELLQALV